MNNKQLERFKKLDTNALSNVSGQGYGAQCVIGTTGMTIVGASFLWHRRCRSWICRR